VSASDAQYSVRFWGVRGGLPTPNAATRRYGGNTACVEVRCNGHLIILDAGTGIRPLGVVLGKAGGTIDADLIFSETRFDHICGLPFFGPGYNPKNSFTVWAGHRDAAGSMQRELSAMMTSPLFPIPLSLIGGLKTYRDFVAGTPFELRPGIAVHTAALDHPFGATGYRLDAGGRTLCYVTGTQHRPEHRSTAVLELIKGADLVIYDSYYSDAEYALGSGHSTWEEGVRLCRDAGARRMVAFEHHPVHDDAFLDRVQQALGAALPGSLVAAEGLSLSV
jgi:phosphoribosyl 1,2-cyclic phosphodiesterase